MDEQVDMMLGAELERVFQQALDAGKFMLQQCKDCGQFNQQVDSCCEHCEHESLRWVEACGRGSIALNYNAQHVKESASNPDEYVLAPIVLEEGVRMQAPVLNLLDDELCSNMQVLAHVGLFDNKATVLFTTVAADEEDEW